MMRHSLLLAVAVGDGLSVLLLLRAGWCALQVMSSWAPDSPGRPQLRLERRIESADIAARCGIGLFFLSSVLVVFGISNVLSAVVPGAMCGTGVVQGTAGFLNKALAFRAVAAAAAYLWAALAGLDRRQPESPLALTGARLLLLAAVLVTAAAVVNARAFSALDLQQPVDCCAVVYDSLRTQKEAFTPPCGWQPWAFGAGSGVLLACGFWVRSAAPGRQVRAAAALCASLAVWLPVAALALVDCFAAYIYEVLQHRCPWCLFLPEHGGVGYLLLAALAAAALEGPVAFASAKAGVSRPPLAAEAGRRCRAAATRVLVAVSVFAFLAVLPAVLWRLRFGLWMG
jgi:hypothetical protein